ncbi:hypothetical protein CTEN210_18579 [Chaetoceros tenuissimus]|uniref:Endo-polygalacturonase n=1 Tax=Chaetoceros tenuissimus TaxID=426638 RepID=A0AAD3HGF4_9STRA|nr:hypothetical protein CTEN210_18579 [Chaetoceros tenuissimus]
MKGFSLFLAALYMNALLVDGRLAKSGSNKNDRSIHAPYDAFCLVNDDFAKGTLIINTPGTYKLCEDIVFDPIQNIELPIMEMYLPDFKVYDRNAYGLGFFAAIAISASNVEIYLNNHSIEQSEGHALMQRFFAVFELANSPFLKSVGPSQFVGNVEFESASNVGIYGPGIIGRSAHHGVHGNDNKNITIRDITFKDFEVAAVSLNNVDDAFIIGNTIPNNRHDVPIVGSFSAATQVSHYGKALKEMNFGMDIKGVYTSAAEVYERLVATIENVAYDVLFRNKGFINEKKHPEEYFLFHNKNSVVDGPCYAFVIHGKGPAVGGFGFELSDSSKMSSNIQIIDNVIENIKCWTNEVPAVVIEDVVQNDARGAILQLIKSTPEDNFLAINSDGTYKRNPVADMQIMTAYAIQQGLLNDNPNLQTVVNTISPSIVKWASSSNDVLVPQYRCNGDSMHHTVKGMTIIRVEDCEGFKISGNNIKGIENLSGEPFENCSSFHAGASKEDTSTQVGNVRVISVAAVTGYNTDKIASKSIIVSNEIKDVQGKSICGIDLQGKSDSCLIDYNIVDYSFMPEEGMEENFALRLRKFVDNSSDGIKAIEIGAHNEFDKSQIQILNNVLDEERMRRLEHLHRNLNIGNEWKLGGCPFGGR